MSNMSFFFKNICHSLGPCSTQALKVKHFNIRNTKQFPEHSQWMFFLISHRDYSCIFICQLLGNQHLFKSSFISNTLITPPPLPHYPVKQNIFAMPLLLAKTYRYFIVNQGIVETICRPFLFHPLLNVSQHKSQ